MPRVAILLSLFLAALAAAQPAAPASTPSTQPHAAPSPEYRTFTAADGRAVRYAVVLPRGYEAVKPYPVVVLLPPGAQDQAMVDRALDLYITPKASERGWVAICPVAPQGSTWQKEGPLLAALLDDAAKSIRSENGLVHLAGISTGGLAAFTLALDQPGRYSSLVVFPGVPNGPGEMDRLDRLKTVPVTIFVGENDADYWLPQSKLAAERIKSLGLECDLTILRAQGHVLSLDPSTLFDTLDLRRPATRAARVARELAIKSIDTLLDDFHDAAAKADENRYFAHFTPDAVFLGTDPDERWTLEKFREFAIPYFQRDSAWVYTRLSRNITISPLGDIAWFDEILDNVKYKSCRGTGVLVRSGSVWRIAQYNLTKPVPNDQMDGLLKLIAEAEQLKTTTQPPK